MEKSAEQLRVLHIYRTYFPNNVTGIPRVIYNLAEGLRAQDVTSTVLTTGPQTDGLNHQIATHDVVEAKRLLEFRSTDISVAFLSEFNRLARLHDVVHFQFPWPWMDLANLLSRHGRPVVVSYQSDIVRQKFFAHLYSPLMRNFLNRADAIVASSPPYAQTSKVLQARKGQVSVIPLGIEDDLAKMRISAEVAAWQAEIATEPYALFLGALRYYKGLKVLVDAAARTKETIVIAGSGYDEPILRAEVKRLGLTNVKFVGEVTEEQKAALMAGCKCFVLPSNQRSEAFGISLLEAATFGKPLISCELGTGTSYVNWHGESGLVVPPDQPTALAEAIDHLMTNDGESDALGAGARARYERLFTRDLMCKAYAETYRRVLAR